ncbi:hypothetical protein [Microcystis aeruginosa]|uniref:Uncharacterized protein n=1 Tax=Microcystis aeruginosa NIES-2521 TaxID=2303983 RepID=A0A5A5S4V0_MICAE|nr:hypothetical protein [Microcystis aeruginosa]GCA81879.1 hypothetical protein MiTs_03898 [Microcystis aeruginosa NIES-2521]
MGFLRPRVPLIPLLNPVIGEVWVKVASGIYVKGMLWVKVNGIYQKGTMYIKVNGLYQS